MIVLWHCQQVVSSDMRSDVMTGAGVSGPYCQDGGLGGQCKLIFESRPATTCQEQFGSGEAMLP